MNLQYFGRSEKGKRDNNEDAFLAEKIGDFWLFAVADGLGGHMAGEQASAMAVKILREEVARGINDPKDAMELIAYQIHDSILAEAATDRKFYGMATTLVAALVDESGSCTVMNIGDSRAYTIQNGVIKHTRDQNMVGDLVASGQITEEEAQNHPLRTVLDQALGDPDSVIEPAFYESNLNDGLLILSSDGFHDFVRKERIMEIVADGETPKEVCEKLIEEAYKAESDDNVTVVVVSERNA
ncbi:MAG: protein phosphatase 2C domain-containing protein [Methanoregula sp.]|jgi:protein phosphatase|nr:protein phosphatase 2C domain-containing protein [Methanoregula sp.]